MPLSVTYPPAPPSISGENVTVSGYLANPTRVQRIVADLTRQRFIADRLFTTGPPAVGGAVLYDQVSAADLYLARDVESIRPAQEFPILTDEAPVPKLAAVEKWGGRVFVSDENRDRNRYDLFARETRKLANTVVRKVDAVAIAALDGQPINPFAGVDWTGATGAQMIANLIDASSLINDPDLGYVADLVLLNPVQFNELLKEKDFRDAMQAGNGESILRDGIIGEFLGMAFGRSNRITPGTGYIASSGLAGGISDEQPLRTVVYREEGQESTFIQSSRRVVPYVTDPLAVTRMTGI